MRRYIHTRLRAEVCLEKSIYLDLDISVMKKESCCGRIRKKKFLNKKSSSNLF